MTTSVLKSTFLFLVIYIPVYLAVQFFLFDAEMNASLLISSFVSGGIASVLIAFLQKKQQK